MEYDHVPSNASPFVDRILLTIPQSDVKIRAAVALDNDNALHTEMLATILFKLDKITEACDVAEEFLKRNPVSSYLLLLLVNCYQKLGDTERASELYRRFYTISGGEIPLDPND